MHANPCAIGLAAALASFCLSASWAQAETAKGHAAHAAGPAAGPAMSDAALTTSAMRAAPDAVGRAATIVAAGADGKMRTLRQGTNGFTCMPDNPATPGPDPMCMDANALAWATAWIKKEPPPKGVGVMYMLEGGTDASNVDPYAQAPTDANHWIKTGPHVMVVGDAAMLSQYPAKPDPDTAQPYVMWAGTPYAHLMMPVR